MRAIRCHDNQSSHLISPKASCGLFLCLMRLYMRFNQNLQQQYLIKILTFLAKNLPSTTPFYASVSKGAASTFFYTFGMVQVTVLRSCLKKHVAELSCCQVWGISETRDQNYRSNARPHLRLADLLTEVVIIQLHRGSER